jgi:predicted TIM-barrel fold metal-dependent hydrolase
MCEIVTRLLLSISLSDTRFINSHLMFLHVGYPFVRSASVMAQSFPNVWIDFAQVIPWEVVTSQAYLMM